MPVVVYEAGKQPLSGVFGHELHERHKKRQLNTNL